MLTAGEPLAHSHNTYIIYVHTHFLLSFSVNSLLVVLLCTDTERTIAYTRADQSPVGLCVHTETKRTNES